jgi:hypothetical protein
MVRNQVFIERRQFLCIGFNFLAAPESDQQLFSAFDASVDYLFRIVSLAFPSGGKERSIPPAMQAAMVAGYGGGHLQAISGMDAIKLLLVAHAAFGDAFFGPEAYFYCGVPAY